MIRRESNVAPASENVSGIAPEQFSRKAEKNAKLSATDKVHDLYRVPVCNGPFRPIGASDDFAIMFDRDSLFWQREMSYQLFDRESAWNFSLFAVESYGDRGHDIIFPLCDTISNPESQI